MKTLNKYEIEWWNDGKKYIVGLDEAGRGPLAGPLVVAAVCFPINYQHEEIYDSKKISAKKREELYDVIIQDALEYQIIKVSCEHIDEVNIYRATQEAMEKCVSLFKHVDGVLSDAMPLPNIKCDVISLIKGDQQSVSIAAASILAKVTRDWIMQQIDLQYPLFGFIHHKGYPTKMHLEAITKYGIIKGLYRESYRPVARCKKIYKTK